MATFSMTSMKNQTALYSVVCLALLIFVGSAGSAPIGTSNEGLDYLIKGRDLSWLGMGVYYSHVERDVTLETGGLTETLDADRLHAYISFSPFSFLTVYAIGGSSEATLVDSLAADEGDSESELGLGLRLNLLDHFFKEPVPYESRYRMTASAEHVRSEMTYDGGSIDWDKTDISLLFGVVNDTVGNKFFTAESMMLYFGAVFSLIDSDEFEEDGAFGGMAGLEIFFTDSFSLDVSATHIDNTSYDVGVNVHF